MPSVRNLDLASSVQVVVRLSINVRLGGRGWTERQRGKPETPATLASTYLTNIDSRTSSVTQEPHTYESVMSVMDTAKPSYCGETPG